MGDYLTKHGKESYVQEALRCSARGKGPCVYDWNGHS